MKKDDASKGRKSYQRPELRKRQLLKDVAEGVPIITTAGGQSKGTTPPA